MKAVVDETRNSFESLNILLQVTVRNHLIYVSLKDGPLNGFRKPWKYILR
jgi:hypothetical protein